MKKDRICLSPYKELGGGWTESIYDHIDLNFYADNQVIMYLKAGCVSIGSLGVYTHPFEPEKTMLGPVFLTDKSNYWWHSDLWEYVEKYHVTLPQEFINHAMSVEGCKFIAENISNSCFYSPTVAKWHKRKLLEKIAVVDNKLK